MTDSSCSSGSSAGSGYNGHFSAEEGVTLTAAGTKNSKCNKSHTSEFATVTTTTVTANWWERMIIHNDQGHLWNKQKITFVDRFYHLESILNTTGSAETSSCKAGADAADESLIRPDSISSFAFPFNVIVPVNKHTPSKYADAEHSNVQVSASYPANFERTKAPNTTITGEQSQYTAAVDDVHVSDLHSTSSTVAGANKSAINDNAGNERLGLMGLVELQDNRKLPPIAPRPAIQSLPTTTGTAIDAPPAIKGPEAAEVIVCEPDYWNVMYQRLCAYQRKHGNCLVPCRYGRDEELGCWVKRQRAMRNMGTLHHKREEKLTQMGFSWCTQFRRHHRTLWNQMFDDLVEYRKAYGNCLVPADYEENPKLVSWIRSQRSAWMHGLMTETRERKLNGIGFEFEWEPAEANTSENVSYEQLWMHMFNQLLTYRVEYGDCLVPHFHAENPRLAAWVHMQRTAYERNNLTDVRIQKLKDIGFAWTVIRVSRYSKKREQTWKERFGQLVEFFKRHGHCFVPNPYPEIPELGIWVASQRRAKKIGTLSVDRERRLAALGFQWRLGLVPPRPEPNRKKKRGRLEYLEGMWNDMFDQLVEYKSKHGDCMVPYDYKDNSRLVYWVRNQRVMKRDGKLRPDREQRLSNIGFKWPSKGKNEAGSMPSAEL